MNVFVYYLHSMLIPLYMLKATLVVFAHSSISRPRPLSLFVLNLYTLCTEMWVIIMQYVFEIRHRQVAP